MAHIADFMVDADLPNSVGLNNFIAREVSPAPSQETPSEVPSMTEEKEKHVWRMHQPSESRRLHLFPSRERLAMASTGRKSPDSASQASKAGEKVQGESDRLTTGSSKRSKSRDTKPKDGQSLVRRRKVSVPELGPMTTVQEVAMDSPTIPGRPALHERSISAPGNSWRQHMFGESMMSCISGPVLDETLELELLDASDEPSSVPQIAQIATRTEPASPSRRPLSPKCLAPLVIPTTSAPHPQFISQRLRQRSESTPPDVPPKSARMKEHSPFGRFSPYTPGSASTTGLSISTLASSIGATPTWTPESQRSPKQWTSPTPTSSVTSPQVSHTRGQSDSTQPKKTESVNGHRRGESEASIMDRGRPQKRLDGSPMKQPASKTTTRRRAESRSSPTEEQRAFAHLPQGIRASNAASVMPMSEIDALRKQAFGQASRFDVLSSKDVENLSRELRSLDERCEYLTNTHRSLRSGRRNLHDRICSFLRSPRVARFSHESILKQEEALSELDSSIDDWVSKLEHAENRRTRVRQKLLEHVAAALILQPASLTSPVGGEYTPPRSPIKTMSQYTPPRSPIKSQSPQRLAEVVKVDCPIRVPGVRKTRMSVESIKIYADNDVYALLADVEDEMNRMGERSESENNVAEATVQLVEKTTTTTTTEAAVTLSSAVYQSLPKTVYKRPQLA